MNPTLGLAPAGQQQTVQMVLSFKRDHVHHINCKVVKRILNQTVLRKHFEVDPPHDDSSFKFSRVTCKGKTPPPPRKTKEKGREE
jgi:hypothetical protein